MPVPPAPSAPPRLEGRHVLFEPVVPGALDPAARGLFVAASKRIARGADPEAALAASLAALGAGACTAWTVAPRSEPPAGLAWLSRSEGPAAGRGIVTGTAGLAWRRGTRPRAEAARFAARLLLGRAFDELGYHSVTLRFPGREPARAPIIASEWPALRAALDSRAPA